MKISKILSTNHKTKDNLSFKTGSLSMTVLKTMPILLAKNPYLKIKEVLLFPTTPQPLQLGRGAIPYQKD